MQVEERDVVFYSEGIEVYGTLTYPRQRRGNLVPGVVLAHGYGSFRDELKGFVELAGKLSEKNICSLRFDFRGCGASGVRGRIHPFAEWIKDLQAAVYFLRSSDIVDSERIGMTGMSVGGGAVCYVSALDPSIRCVVALAPVADGEWWLRHLWSNQSGGWDRFLKVLERDLLLQVAKGKSRRVPIGEVLAYGEVDLMMAKQMMQDYPAFTQEVFLSSPVSLMQFKPRCLAHLIEKTPIRFVHSQDDTSVPVRHSKEIYEQVRGPKDLQLVTDSPHCFWLGEKSEQVQALTIEWLCRHL